MPSTVLADWLRNRGPSPAIAWYGLDEVRVELSGLTAANAVAKAVNLFRGDLLLDAGDLVWLDLPCHWQAPLLAVASWAAGLCVAVGPVPPTNTAATLSTGAGAAAGIPLAVSLHPWGLPLGSQTPAGWEDYGALARSQPDRTSFTWPSAGDTWLLAEGRPYSGSDLLARAEELAQAWGVEPSGRLFSSLPVDTEVGLLAATLVPAVVGGSVIFASSDAQERILRQEGNAAVVRDV
jgi:uncharacterized protein (TIGR03089 family)